MIMSVITIQSSVSRDSPRPIAAVRNAIICGYEGKKL